MYDAKRDDFNARLSRTDGLVHHHNGICDPNYTPHFDIRDNQALIADLHEMENELVNFGLRQIGDLMPSARVLDAGCGRGGPALMMYERFGCEIVGLTLSSYQAEFAARMATSHACSDRLQFVVGDMTDTKFPSESFDGVWACESTEHITDLPALFSEFCRVLKPAGRLLVITWAKNPNHPHGELIATGVDEAYLTTIHSVQEYLAAASGAELAAESVVNLTEETGRYWQLRRQSRDGSGTEELMTRGFGTSALEYFSMKFLKL